MQDSKTTRFMEACQNTPFAKLPLATQRFLQEKALCHKLSFSHIRQLIVLAADFHMWQVPPLETQWEEGSSAKATLEALHVKAEAYRQALRDYSQDALPLKKTPLRLVAQEKESLGLGSCPVASPKTRCCNLLTLDAVEGCGFDCSYCSIRTFYGADEVRFDTTFAQKLAQLKLDKEQVYHIGTGQSSDSLMWGNREGVLDALIAFAQQHPNVILELKTKSNTITHLLKTPYLPRNMLFTWSLNPQPIIDHEEHYCASLEERLDAARALADKGALVGFHFHPMLLYQGWEEGYGAVAKRLLALFDPKEVALVSLGTLTFIKPVLKSLRAQIRPTKILQMPLVQTHGKFSYPLETKRMMFSYLYEALRPWHQKVFFYLCMEDESLWKDVFGFEYEDNAALEEAMKNAYREKIGDAQCKQC